MPRVLRIANRFNLGGPTYNVGYLTRHLAPEFETLLIGGQHDETEEGSHHILEDMGIKPVIIPEMMREISPGIDYKAYRKVREIIADFKPDIVHTHASKAGAIGRQAAISMKVPVIVHTFHGHYFHSYFSPYKTAFYKVIERRLARRSDAIIAISDTQKYELGTVHGICPPDKITVVPLGFDLTRFRTDRAAKRARFRSEFELNDDDVAIGIIGRLVPIKNHGLFLRAVMKAVNEADARVVPFIVGDGELHDEVLGTARQLGLHVLEGTARSHERDTLYFTSWRKDIDVVMAGLDVNVLTSFNEGTPVSLIEAQASGTPVVSTDVGGVRDVVRDEVTGFIVPLADEDALAERLTRLATDHELRHHMSGLGWDVVGEAFHYTRLVSDMAQLYGRLLAEKGVK